MSDDSGKTWGDELVIPDDVKFSDMGYPSTVKLPEVRLFIIWHEKMPAEQCLLRIWTLEQFLLGTPMNDILKKYNWISLVKTFQY